MQEATNNGDFATVEGLIPQVQQQARKWPHNIFVRMDSLMTQIKRHAQHKRARALQDMIKIAKTLIPAGEKKKKVSFCRTGQRINRLNR